MVSRKQRDKNKSAAGGKQRSKDHGESASPHPLISAPPSQPPQAPQTTGAPDPEPDEWWHDPKTVLEAVGLFVLIVYTVFTGLMWWANKKSADAANSAAKTARDTLIATDRPWLTADVRLAGPLVFDRTGAVSVPVWYAVKNTGHSPAVKAWAFPELFLPRNPETEPNIEREKFCSSVTRMTNGTGQAIFPSGSAPDPAGVVSTAVAGNIVRQAESDGFISPTIILCIAYQTTLEDKWHHTGMIFDIFQITNGERLAIKVGQNVPQNQLASSVSIFHGVTAD